MSTDDRDPVVARALATLPVPAHGPDFWSRLDEAVRTAEAPRAGAARLRPVPDAPAGQAPPPLVDLVAQPRRRPGGRRWAAAAAAVVVLGGAAAGARLLGDEDDAGTAPATAGTSAVTTAAPPATAAVAAPELVVAQFLDAVGRGEVPTATALLGPVSATYLEGFSGGVEDMLRTSAEGYGAWVGSTDRTFTQLALGPGDAVVVVQGTRMAEGVLENRADAVPVVRGADGRWKVELWAFGLAEGGRMPGEISPVPGADGVRVVAAGTEVVVPVDGVGSVWFSLTGSAPVEVPVPAGEVAARWTAPAGGPADGGLLVAAFRSERVFTAVALPVRGA